MPHSAPQPTPLTFRIATTGEEDLNSISKLVNSAYRGESSRAGWTTEADLVGDTRINPAGVAEKINTPGGVIVLAHDDQGRLASCCELLKQDDYAYFGLFAVDPQRQSGGIGKSVMNEAERYAKEEMGVKTMEMTVIWTREELIAWYERRGYVRTDEKKPFPYGQLENGTPLRDDLYFRVLKKQLV